MTSHEGARVLAVIPTHNRPEGLAVALASVLEQDIEDLVVAVVDEASTPPAVVPEDPRVRLIRHAKALGPAAARNRGASAERAEFVAFLDDDDRWLPGKLKRCLEVLANHPDTDVVIHDMAFAGAPRAGTGEVRVVAEPLHRMLSAQPPHLGAVVVRQQAHNHHPFDTAFAAAEDLDYLIRLAQIGRFVEIGEVLAEHGPSDQRVSAISLERRIAARKQLFDKHAGCFDRAEYRAFHLARMGHLYRRAGRRDLALRQFGAAVRARPTSAMAWRGMWATVLPRAMVHELSRRGSS